MRITCLSCECSYDQDLKHTHNWLCACCGVCGSTDIVKGSPLEALAQQAEDE